MTPQLPMGLVFPSDTRTRTQAGQCLNVRWLTLGARRVER
jgi:hypothetical protein